MALAEAPRRTNNYLHKCVDKWAEVQRKLEEPVTCTDFEERPLEPPPSPVPASALAVPPDELRKASKRYQHAVHQYRDSIAAEGHSAAALESAAAEVLNTFEECLDLLLTMRNGACTCLREELREVGAHLTEVTRQLGCASGAGEAKQIAGMATDCAKDFEKISPHNRAATRRRINSSLAELRDIEQQLSQALLPPSAHGAPSCSDEDEDLDLGESDFQELDPAQRRVIEALARTTTSLETLLQDASQACISVPVSSFAALSGIASLEAVALQATAATRCIQGLSACCVGELDFVGARPALTQLCAAARAVTDCSGDFGGPGTQACGELMESLKDVDEALEAAVNSPMHRALSARIPQNTMA